MGGNVNTVRTARETIANRDGLIAIDFFQSTSKLLHKIIENDISELNSIKQELALIERVPFRIHKRGNYYVFGVIPEGRNNEQGITRDKVRVHKLARREILKDRKALLEIQLKKMHSVDDVLQEISYEGRIAKKLHRYDDAGLDLTRILFTKEQNEWIDQPFHPNPYNQEQLKYATSNNIFMRSKSEAAIGSKLEEMGLPYRYDDFVSIGNNVKAIKNFGPEEGPFRGSYYADFKFPNLLGGITVHEHLGAFQIKGYGDGSLKRLNDYHNYGVIEIPDRPVKYNEFTWSFESDVSNKKTLEKLVAKILLPGLL